MDQLKERKEDFRNFLAETADKKAYVKVHYYSEWHELLKTTSVVKSLEKRSGNFCLILASGEEIPFDKLVRVGNSLAPGQQDDDFYSCGC